MTALKTNLKSGDLPLNPLHLFDGRIVLVVWGLVLCRLDSWGDQCGAL